MKKLLLSLFMTIAITLPSSAATWVAADRVPTVGKKIITANSLPSTITFKVVDGTADNTYATTNNTIQISSTDLSYTGNDNEVAYVVAHELGGIICDNIGKKKVRNFLKNALTSNLSSDNVISTAVNSDYVSNKQSMSDNKNADIMGTDLMINAGYNPLAGIVVLTKMPGSSWEILQGKPANSERAMYIYDYLTYNFPTKVQAGYGCNEYRAFLTYANPIVEERNSSKSKLNKFNKEQKKLKSERDKQLSKYKATGGLSSWNVSYELLKSITEPENE